MSEQGADMRVLVEEIAKVLVDDPAQVEVEAIEEDGETVLELRVAPDDIGKIIGKQGRTARSLRTILSAASMKLHHRYELEIVEDDDEDDGSDIEGGEAEGNNEEDAG